MERRQKEDENGCHELRLRALNSQYNLQFQKNIEAAKFGISDLPKFVRSNFVGQIQHLNIILRSAKKVSENIFIEEMKFIQKKYMKNLKTVEFFIKEVDDDDDDMEVIEEYSARIIFKIDESFELDGIKFICKKKIIIVIHGHQNQVVLKNSNFNRVGLGCLNCDVKVYNTKFLSADFLGVSNEKSFLHMENVIFSSCKKVAVRGYVNGCIIENISLENNQLLIRECKNFQISDANLSDTNNGIVVQNSTGKIMDSTFEKIPGFGICLKEKSTVHVSNLQSEGFLQTFAEEGSSIIQEEA